MKQSIISKNTEIIELETEKKNWNKVSYTKFLDKKKDLEVMKIRFDHINKQNTEYRKKILDMKNQIKELCLSNNIDIDISDNISIADSNAEISIIDNSLENSSEQNIKMDILFDEDEVASQKNDSTSNNVEENSEHTLQKETVEVTNV